MSFDNIPENREESLPCKCGGNIIEQSDAWECDQCEFRRTKKVMQTFSSDLKI